MWWFLEISHLFRRRKREIPFISISVLWFFGCFYENPPYPLEEGGARSSTRGVGTKTHTDIDRFIDW